MGFGLLAMDAPDPLTMTYARRIQMKNLLVIVMNLVFGFYDTSCFRVYKSSCHCAFGTSILFFALLNLNFAGFSSQ